MKLKLVRGRPAPGPVILPVASLEYHGPSLPLGSDIVIAECVVSKLEDHAYIAPVVAYSTALEHAHVYAAGSQPTTFIQYLAELVESLASSHSCIIVAVFHGGATAAAVMAARLARRRSGVRVRVYSFWDHVLASLGLREPIHAGPIEASILAACGTEIKARRVEPERAISLARTGCRLGYGWLGEDCPRIYEAVDVYSTELGARIVNEAVEALRRELEACSGGGSAGGRL